LGIVGEQQVVDVAKLPSNSLGVWIEEELCLIEAQPPLRSVLAAHLVAVELPRPEPWDKAVPDEFGAMLELNDVSGLPLRSLEQE